MFQGLSAFPITPADPDGSVDTDALCRLVERLDVAGVDSIGLLGSTGGYAYLSRDERRRAVEAASGCVGGGTPLIVGVGALRTDRALELSRDAREAGADALLLAPMSYTPLTDEEVYRHFVAVAEATDLPLCIYNNSGTTRFAVGEPLLERLATVENIAAVKMPSPADGDVAGELGRLRALVPGGFAIGYSGDWGAASAVLAGADAWYSVVAGLLPLPALKLIGAARTGDVSEIERIDGCFQPLWTLFKKLGSFRVMYAVASVLSLCDAAPPRPVLPISATDRCRVEDALDRLTPLTCDRP